MNNTKIAKHRTHDTDNVYYNLTISNHTTHFIEAITENVIRTQNIIDRCADYYMSIIRFSLPNTLPVVVLKLVNTTDTDFRISYQGWDTDILDPEIVNSDPALTPMKLEDINLEGVDIIDGYIYFYDMQTFQMALNKFSLRQMIDDPVFAHAILDDANETAFIYYDWNPNTTQWSLVFPTTFFGPDLDKSVVRNIYYNYTAYRILGPLPGYVDFNAVETDQYFEDNFYVNSGDQYEDEHFYNGVYKSVSVGSTGMKANNSLIKITSTKGLMDTQVTRIILKSANIPIEGEQLGTGASSEKILTDFVLPQGPLDGDIIYNPPGQYRLIDLKSQSPLRQIDISVFYEDRYGNIRTYNLFPNMVANFKLAFFHKPLYNNDFAEDEQPVMIEAFRKTPQSLETFKQKFKNSIF